MAVSVNGVIFDTHFSYAYCFILISVFPVGHGDGGDGREGDSCAPAPIGNMPRREFLIAEE